MARDWVPAITSFLRGAWENNAGFCCLLRASPEHAKALAPEQISTDKEFEMAKRKLKKAKKLARSKTLWSFGVTR